ncbi:hypothetical protein [Streptomyces uncialis]|uniref:hypothetical protein n=1 Tax=Streptomyces uncialis TaxID=1048205 RepID=UPI00093A62F8|nr:hypothetical protein [Streptomyces uncialis]WTE15341.1 hypothetical protein OG924_36905 [Streptomyces uncialis]
MSIDPADFAARLRAEQNAPDREERLRRERVARRRKTLLGAGAGVLALGGLGVWLADATGKRPANEPYAPRMLAEHLWPDAWPATTNIPFRGSPAAAWEPSSHGIRIPQAKAVAGLTLQEVHTSLWLVKDFLVATNISSRTLAGAKPVEALDLLAPGDPVRRQLEAAYTDPGSGREPLRFVTRFDPDEVRSPEQELIRTDGTMTYEAAPSGELLVRADYTFVHALVKTSGAKEINDHGYEVSRVIVHRQLDVLVRNGKLHPQTHSAAIVNDDCTAPADGFIHPLFHDDLKKADKWATVDPYAEKNRVAAAPPGACVRPTRT